MNKYQYLKSITLTVISMGLIYSQTTLFKQSSKVKPITKTINESIDEVGTAFHQLLILTEIRYELNKTTSSFIFDIMRTPIAPKNGEVGEFFGYEKLGEDALTWEFDESSLKEGRIANINSYLKDPSKGIGGMTKMMGPSMSGPITTADFEGKITLKKAGRTKTMVKLEIVFFTGTIPCKSNGFLEKELLKSCNYILSLESRIVPTVIDSIMLITKEFFNKNGLEIEEEWETGLMSKRFATDTRGERTINKFAKVRKQLLATWIGNYKVLVTYNSLKESTMTEVKPIILYMAINGNNGKRRWEIYPTRGLLEEEFFNDIDNIVTN